jgi:hypothetical protein
MTLKSLQNGTTTVEFALIGFLFFLVLFGILEIGRMMFTINSLAESTRRTARLAVVCPLEHDQIPVVGNFNQPGESGENNFIFGMNASNLDIDYLDESGNETAILNEVEFVRVSIVDYEYDLLIPGLSLSLTSPTFTTTLPAESLGIIPDIASFQCFGSG